MQQAHNCQTPACKQSLLSHYGHRPSDWTPLYSPISVIMPQPNRQMQPLRGREGRFLVRKELEFMMTCQQLDGDDFSPEKSTSVDA